MYRWCRTGTGSGGRRRGFGRFLDHTARLLLLLPLFGLSTRTLLLSPLLVLLLLLLGNVFKAGFDASCAAAS